MKPGVSSDLPVLRARSLLVLLAAAALFLTWAIPAHAVSGAGYTTVDETVDGSGHCKNGNPNVNCNSYDGKRYVWLNGGPTANHLGPDGQYFFAVLVPGRQPDPNDSSPVSASDKNLSDDYDTYANRTFTVTNGEVGSYLGTHDYDPLEQKIRLLPYSNTSNPGGVYILAICSLEDGYPVDPRSCKYDAFKVPGPDTTPPRCPSPSFGVNSDGEKTATQVFEDDGGLDSIDIVSITNATYTLSGFFQGTAGKTTLVGTKIDPGQRSRIEILVTDVAGNQVECDPVLTTLKIRSVARASRLAKTGTAKQRIRRLSRSDDLVTIRSGRRPLARLAVVVNGRRFVVRHLGAKSTRRLHIRRALVPRRNTVVLRAHGRRGARADVMISN